MLRTQSVVVLIAFLIGAPLIVSAADVTIPDKNLEALIREILKKKQIEKPKISDEDLKTIFFLNGNGRGITWGLCHINPDGGGSTAYSILSRFDCDLSLDVDRPLFKNNNLRFNERTYLQERVRLPDYLENQIKRDRTKVDRDTVPGR